MTSILFILKGNSAESTGAGVARPGPSHTGPTGRKPIIQTDCYLQGGPNGPRRRFQGSDTSEVSDPWLREVIWQGVLPAKTQRRKVLIDSTLRVPSILLTQNAGANSGGNGKLALMPESHGFNRWLCAPSSDHFECSFDLAPFPLFEPPQTAGRQVRHIGSTPATTQATGL